MYFVEVHRQGRDTSIIEDCPDVFHVSTRPVWGEKKNSEEERDILTVDCDFYCFGVRRGDVI